MDFRAYTPVDAALELIARIEEIASSRPETISARHDGILHDRHRIICNRFEAEVSIDARKWHFIKSKVGLFDLRFGTGVIAISDAPVLLELWRDEEKEYRWHRVAARWTMRYKRVKRAREAHWFPLTDQFLTDLLTGEATQSETPARVLVMK